MTENNKKEVLKPIKKLWNKTKKNIKATNGVKSIKYKSLFMKTEVDSDDKLPLNNILYVPVLDIIAESVFQVNDGHCSHIYIDECEYECE